MCLNWPKNGIVLDGINTENIVNAVLLGTDRKVIIIRNGKGVTIKPPLLTPDDYQLAYVFRISGLVK